MIEVEVHQQLRAFLREQGEPYWPHHLTMARLVARALRVERSALIQVGAPSGYYGRYRLSYLMPALIWTGPVLLVVPEPLRQRLLMVEIPRLQQWIATPKPIQMGDRWPSADYRGLLLTSPEAWLRDRLEQAGRFPDQIPTIIDGVEDLDTYTRDQLTVGFQSQDWDHLMLACPTYGDTIRDIRVQLTRLIFQHPPNPYECYLLDSPEQELLNTLNQTLTAASNTVAPTVSMPINPCQPTEQWRMFLDRLQRPDSLTWTTLNRAHGQFSLHCSPVDVSSALQSVWHRQPLVLIGGLLDLDSDATAFRQQIGLGDLTCLKFAPDRQNDLIQLYLPDRMPMPNTPQFQSALLQELRSLLGISAAAQELTVLLVGDTPLKTQVAARLASEFGSRVQVEKTCLDENAILVTGWEFWRQHQAVLPAPRLLAIATLPIPSLENPLVSGRVAHYKRLRQNWFRLYLLPETLSELQRAIAPMRESQGVVALLDNRVNHRSYGHQVLAALSPYARTDYLDAKLFAQ